MVRTALPQNYTFNEGILLEDFESISGWEHIWPVGGITNNPTEHKTGTQSIKFFVTNGSIAASHAISKNFGVCPRLMTLWVYLHTAPSTFASLSIRIYSSVAEGGYATACLTATLSQNDAAFSRLTEGWNLLPIHRDDWVGTGGESWANEMKWIRISASCVGTSTLTLSLDGLYYAPERTARCLITYDDARLSAFTEGYNYMQQRGIKGTIYVNPPTIGTSTYMTLDNLNTVYNAGWALGNHTYHHVNLTTLATQAEMETEIRDCTNWLINNRFPRAAYHFAYPFSAYNNRVLDALSVCNMLTGRIGITGHVCAPGGNQILLKLRDSGGATAVKTLAEMKAFVDRAIKYDATVFLLFHELVTTITQTGTQWLISDFHALIDYIAACKIKCVTIDEWYNGLTNPRYRSLPLSRAVV